MGMYDTINFSCPRCYNRLEAQSKAGECDLINYEADSVPAKIALDIRSETVWCQSCDREYVIEIDSPVDRVGMHLRERR